MSNDPNSVTYGDLIKRASANVADGFFLAIPVVIAISVHHYLVGKSTSSDEVFQLGKSLYYLIVPLIYFTLTVGKYGRSWGKKSVHLRILKKDGTPIGFGIAFLRYLFMFVYGIPLVGIVLLIVSAAFVLFDKKKQALHDKIMKTVVVYEGK